MATWALWTDVTRDSTGVFVELRCFLNHGADACVMLLRISALAVHRFHDDLCVGLFVVSRSVDQATMVVQGGWA